MSSSSRRYVAGPAKSAMKKAAIVGALWGYSNGVLFAFYALSWWWAGQLLEDGKLTASVSGASCARGRPSRLDRGRPALRLCRGCGHQDL